MKSKPIAIRLEVWKVLKLAADTARLNISCDDVMLILTPGDNRYAEVSIERGGEVLAKEKGILLDP